MIALDFVRWGCERILKKERWRLKLCIEKRVQLCSDKRIYNFKYLQYQRTNHDFWYCTNLLVIYDIV